MFRHKFSCCLSQEGQHRCPPAASPPHPADLASEMPQECPRGAQGSTGGSGWVHLDARQCGPMHCAARSLAGRDERQQMRAVRLSRCLISHSTVLLQPCSCPAVPRGGRQQPALQMKLFSASPLHFLLLFLCCATAHCVLPPCPHHISIATILV